MSLQGGIDMSFKIVHNDITKMGTDAIVNAANERLRAGSGVCGAIFRAVGDKATALQRECFSKAPCPTGQSIVTDGYGLCQYIIHTVGPVWLDGTEGEEDLLRSCYATALQAAFEHKCKSIAFPLISAGIYGYPKVDAQRVAQEEIQKFLQTHQMDVYLVLL